MFSNFREAFVEENQFSNNPPQSIIEQLNEDLPEGLFYIHDHDGFCRIDSETGLHLEGGKLILPKEAKGIITDKSSISDIYKYSYNSQKAIKVLGDEEGNIQINGQKIRIQDMVKAPLKNVVFENAELSLIPSQFPDPFKICIKDALYSKELKVQRIPNNSINNKSFRSCDDSIISIEYEIKEDLEQKFSFNISVDIKKSKSVKDIVEAYHIFNSFMDGEGIIENVKLAALPNNDKKKISEETIRFWDKVLCLEEYLQLEFNVKDGLEDDDIVWIERLYCSLIEQKPFKHYKIYNSVSGTGGIDSLPQIEPETEMYLEFIANLDLNLFGVHIELFELTGLFGNTLVLPKKDEISSDGEYIAYLKKVEGKKQYSVSQFFVNMDSLETVRKDENHIEMFSLAREVGNEV